MIAKRPNEAVVRAALVQRLARSRGVRLVEEFWVPETHERADLVRINGSMDAFEIKTEFDRLDRLPRQVSAYSRMFDSCTAVVARKHIEGTLEVVPDWWGVMAVVHVGETIRFSSVRAAKPNRQVNAAARARLLWRNELFEVLLSLGRSPNVAASRAALRGDLESFVESGRLNALVTRVLGQRDPSSARIETRRYARKTFQLEGFGDGR